MRVLFLNYNDYANFSYSLHKSLLSVGVESRCLTLTPHAFAYKEQAELTTRHACIQECKDADVIILCHSDPSLIELIEGLKGKKIFVTHTGTRFRQNPTGINALFNPLVDGCITDQTEFMDLGMKNPSYIAVAIDTDNLIPRKKIAEKLVIGHFPSNPEIKGTKDIEFMLRPFKDRFHIVIDDTKVSHEQNIERMQQCDIYIELFAPKQYGKEYGCYGVTAFEASSMGKIVITQNMYPKVYDDVYGLCPFILANNANLFDTSLRFLERTNLIESMQKVSRERMIGSHSYKATGERLRKLLGV